MKRVIPPLTRLSIPLPCDQKSGEQNPLPGLAELPVYPTHRHTDYPKRQEILLMFGCD